jgi:threonine aldolase
MPLERGQRRLKRGRELTRSGTLVVGRAHVTSVRRQARRDPPTTPQLGRQSHLGAPRAWDHAAMAPDEEEIVALRAGCTRFLTGHGQVTAAGMLATIPAGTEVDRYGKGGVVATLESEIASLLGKPAAVFLPSGTMAQQSVLRVHADQRQRRTIVFHPMCHLEQHEEQAHQRLHGLIGRPAGNRNRLIELTDLQKIAEPVAALLIELPQRDIGGQQPPWDELVAQCAWAAEVGAAAHLDGARLWESAAGYGRHPGEIAALFDTVYVSFYKGIGALPGCCVAGPADVIAQVRDWRKRMGGTLFCLWPNAASALSCLAVRLPKMPVYTEHAKAIAAEVAKLDTVRVIPDPPQTPMMHLLLRTTPQRFADGVRSLALDQGVWAWREPKSTGDPDVQRLELSVGDATCTFNAAEVAAIIASFT